MLWLMPTEDGDCSRLQGFSGLEEKIIGDDNEESGESEYDAEEEAWGHTSTLI